MKVLEYLKNMNYKLQLEKLVVGVEEPIFVKGIGTVLAKVDSGNGAYNVLHGEDFYYQGDVVVFTTYDEDEQPHKVSKKIQDTITINIGAGHTEDRPVVLFDVKFANDEYQNVPFTIGNRTNNKNKVLLGKEFLINNLNALIDVSSEDIAKQNIQVEVPIEEASIPDTGGNYFSPRSQKLNPSGSTSTLGKIYQGTKGAIRGAYNMYKTLGSNADRSIGNNIDTLKKNWADMMLEIKDYQQNDKYIIFKALNADFMASGQPIKPFVNNPQVFKILDYLGNNYSGKNISEVNDANQNSNNSSQNQQSSTQNKQQNSTNIPRPSNQPSLETNPGTEIVNSSVINDNNIIKEDIDNTEDNTKVFDKATKKLATEARPILYLVIFDGKQTKEAKDILARNYPNYNASLYEIMRDIKSDFYTETTTTLARNIIRDLKQENILSTFALVSGIKGNRKAIFLASAFEPSLFTSFLTQYTKNYSDELLIGFNGEIDQRFKEGQFINNPIFGFNFYKRGNTQALAGLPDSQIKNWIFDQNAHKGYNVAEAFKAFTKNKGQANNEFTNDTNDNPEDDSFGDTSNDYPGPEPSNPSGGESFTSDTNSQSNSESEQQSQTDNEQRSNSNRDQGFSGTDDIKRIGSDTTEEEKPEEKTESNNEFPKEAPSDFIPPKKARKLNNGRYLWKDTKTGIYIEYDPVTNTLYDALELRRQRPKEENEENILEWTTSTFILDCLLNG